MLFRFILVFAGISSSFLLITECISLWAFQVVLEVKNLPANAGDIRDVGLIPGLGRSAGGGNATHSSILAWRIPQTEEPGVYSPQGHKELDTTAETLLCQQRSI